LNDTAAQKEMEMTRRRVWSVADICLCRRWEKEEEKLRLQAKDGPKPAGPSTDYTMKEGQTIKINFGKKTASGASASQASVSRGVHAHAPPLFSTVRKWLGISGPYASIPKLIGRTRPTFR
jgi:hypothetical protein